jgi:hypothetical protein
VESPEPSESGDWFVLDMERLTERGIRYVEIHFDTDSEYPNEVQFSREDGQ